MSILKRNFADMDIEGFVMLYKTFVRCHLEYAESLWNVHYTYQVEQLEKVQKRATKIVKQCKHLSYCHRLKFLNLPTLVFRRNRGDMTEVAYIQF